MAVKVRILIVGLALSALVLAGGAAAAGDEKGKKAKAEMDEKAMMEAWAKFATPSEGHKTLEPFVGIWETKVKLWMKPGAPPEESAGVSENRWVLGGRYIEQRYEGQFMGQPFSGVGYTGYDNFKKKYVGTWMDTAGTGIMTTSGAADASGKTMTFTGQVDDIMTGKTEPMKEVVTVFGNDRHRLEMWGPAPDGSQYKTMEIEYTRKK